MIGRNTEDNEVIGTISINSRENSVKNDSLVNRLWEDEDEVVRSIDN